MSCATTELRYCLPGAMSRSVQVLEPGLSRMVLPVLSRILTLHGIARPDLSKGAVYIPWVAQICRAALPKGCQTRFM